MSDTATPAAEMSRCECSEAANAAVTLPAEPMLPAIDPAETDIFQTIAQSFQVEALNQVRDRKSVV